MKAPSYLKPATLILGCLFASYFSYRFFAGTPVTIAFVERGPAVEGVYATGTVEPEIMLPIATRWTGRLAELKVDEGEAVLKDQIVARLENEDLQSALDVYRSKEAYAKKNLDRNELLFQQKAVAREAYERAKSEWEAAHAATSQAAAQANFMNLIAPADGSIIRRDGEIGQLIPANQAIFWLSVHSPLRITAEVDEEDVSQVQTGQEVVIRADAFPGQIFKGTVKSITPKGDPVARSYRVRIELNEETPLKIGMTAETNIIIRKKSDALLVPTSALDGNELWKVTDGRLHRTTVKLGVRGIQKSEILEGVHEGDQIVTQLAPNLREDLRVRAQ